MRHCVLGLSGSDYITREFFAPDFIEHNFEGAFNLSTELIERAIEEIIAIDYCKHSFTQNHCYILLGLSGSGKTTLINHLLGYVNGIRPAIKATTRPPRFSKEENVEHISFPEFWDLSCQEELIATHRFHGHLYGYRRSNLEAAIHSGEDLFIDTCDVEAAKDLKEIYPNFVRVVVLEPSSEVLFGRIIERYERMLLYNNLDRVRGARDLRVEEVAARRVNHFKDKMMGVADFIFSESFFSLKQAEIRNYILNQRFLDVIK